MGNITQQDIGSTDLAGDIVGTYVSKVLMKLTAPSAPAIKKLTPSFPIRTTVTPDHIISLEDGKPYKSLKRHLSTRGLTPEEHHRKWGLSHDYPLIAATYAATLRSGQKH